MSQTVIVVGILLAAGAYLARKLWRSLASVRRAKDGPGCGTGCGCE